MANSNAQQTPQFIVAWTNPGNEDMLKAEVKLKNPTWLPSFSCKGLISFKNTGKKINEIELAKIDLAFARRLGIFLKKHRQNEWPDFLKQTTLPVQCYLPVGKLDSPLASASFSPINVLGLGWLHGPTIQVVFLGKEFWSVSSILRDDQFGTPGATLPIQDELHVPSRAYFKMSHSFKIHKHDWNTVIELGGAPGGITQALLEKEMIVHTVDSAKLDDTPYFTQKIAEYKLIVYQESVQNFLGLDINLKNADAVVSDMNIPCEQNLHLSLEVAKKYGAKEIWLTLKMPVPKLLKKIPEFEKVVRFWGATKMMWYQMPAHRREILLIAKR